MKRGAPGVIGVRSWQLTLSNVASSDWTLFSRTLPEPEVHVTLSADTSGMYCSGAGLFLRLKLNPAYFVPETSITLDVTAVSADSRFVGFSPTANSNRLFCPSPSGSAVSPQTVACLVGSDRSL